MAKSIKYLVGVALILTLAGWVVVERGNRLDNMQGTPLEKVRVQAGWLLNGEFANVCSAIVNGYYEKRGLDVELVPGGPTGASFVIATNAVALDDSLTLGIDGDLVPLLRGKDSADLSKRITVKAIGAFWNQNPFGFMVREDSGLNSIKDFAKRKPDGSKYRIGVTADSVIQYAIAKYIGIPVENLDLVTVGFDASSFLSKQVDALAGYWTTQAYEAEKAGINYKFLPASELPGFNQPSMIVVATQKTIADRKNTLVKWFEATIEGTRFVEQNPDVAAQEILDPRCGGPSFDKDQEVWLIRKSIPLFDTTKPGWIYEAQVSGFTSAYQSLNQITRHPISSELIDYSILNEIYQ